MSLKIKIMVISILFLSYFNNNLNAQQLSVNQILNKTVEFYKGINDYEILTTYSLHPADQPNVFIESYQGVTIKNQKRYHYKLLSSEVYIFDNKQLVVDHREQTVNYNIINYEDIKFPVDFESYIELYDEQKVIEDKEYVICELSGSSKNIQNPYSKIVIYLNKKTYALVKQELFLKSLIPFKNETGVKQLVKGKMTVALKFSEKNKKTIPLFTDFIKVDNTNENMLVKEELKSYKLISQ